MTDRTTFAQFTDAVRNCLALILHVSLARLAVKMSKIKELASQQEADVKRFAFSSLSNLATKYFFRRQMKKCTACMQRDAIASLLWKRTQQIKKIGVVC